MCKLNFVLDHTTSSCEHTQICVRALLANASFNNFRFSCYLLVYSNCGFQMLLDMTVQYERHVTVSWCLACFFFFGPVLSYITLPHDMITHFLPSAIKANLESDIPSPCNSFRVHSGSSLCVLFFTLYVFYWLFIAAVGCFDTPPKLEDKK